MIRKACPEDMKFLVRGMWDLIEELRELTDDPYFTELTKNDRYMFRGFFEELLAEKDTDILIASQNNIPVGFTVCKTRENSWSFSKIKKIGEILCCWVKPDQRHKGFGEQLAENAEKLLREKRIKYVHTHWLAENDGAEKFWQKEGYKPFQVFGRKLIR